MKQKDGVRLKAGKEKPIRNRHHWIFSGAIESMPSFHDGDILPVLSHSGEPLGWGYFNSKAAITGRMLSFEAAPFDPKTLITHRLTEALALRESLFASEATDSYRLVNGEGDQLPGLIIDRYKSTFVVQVSTVGMDKLKHHVVAWLQHQFFPISIYEKSLLPSRKEEGLPDFQGPLFGKVPAEEVIIKENGLQFAVYILHGQKTGFFLDHREMRKHVGALSRGKKVLNCFSYTGGFSVYAAAGGAEAVTSVDISDAAIKTAEHNMQLNGLENTRHSFLAADVFEFLRESPLDYGLVILDPPAFAKRQKDVVSACRGYKDINRLAMQKMPSRSLLLTSSCSYHIDEKLFQTVVFQAAVEAGRVVRIIGRHRLAPDHPVNLCHPEGDYLKSLLLYIE